MRYLIYCGWHIGDILGQFPALKYLTDHGNKVFVYCPPEYRDLFSLISYAELVPEPSVVTYDHHLNFQLHLRGEYTKIGQGGVPPYEFIYTHLYRDIIGPAHKEPIIFDKEVPVDLVSTYKLPEKYNLVSPFGYSQIMKPSLEWMIKKAIELFGSDKDLYVLSDKPVPDSRYPVITAKRLAHLPAIIKNAQEFFTTNSAPTYFASVVRKKYYHLYAPEFDGITDWKSPKQIVIYHEEWPRP